MPEAVIVDTVRTPIGRAFKGSLAQLRPEETGAYVIDQLLERNPEVAPDSVDEVFAGCGMPQGLQAFNIARIMTLLSEKLPQETTAVTMSRYCASSLDSIRHAANSIKAGQGDTYVAAGVECPKPETLAFHKTFLKDMVRRGRLHEMRMMGEYNMATKRPFHNFALGPKMFLKGRLSLLPPKGVKGFKRWVKKLWK